MEHMKMRQRVNILIFVIIVLLIILFYKHDSRRNVSEKCVTSSIESRVAEEVLQNLPNIFAITPTYARPVQKAELTRLAQTLMLVPNLHWIIVEDSNQTSALVEGILRRTKLNTRSTQLNIKTPDNFKLKSKDPNWSKPRGVEQRNLALSWIRNYFDKIEYRHSVIFFMDDDNTYSLELFDEMSKIEPSKVGVWPVGLVGGLKVEKPILDENNIVIGFNSLWRPERPFPVDMAGFAIAADLIVNNVEAQFSYDVQRGYQESEILRHATILKDMQPLANLCRDVLVWHTRTETPKLEGELRLEKSKKLKSDHGMEV